MKVSIIVALVVLAAVPLFIGQACTDNTRFGNDPNGNYSMNSGASPNKPILDCDVLNTSVSPNALIMRLTDLSSSTSYPLNPPTELANVRIDCSRSSSPVGSALSFAFTDGGVPLASSGAVAQLNSLSHGVRALRVNITDSGGLSNSKAFNLTVACSPGLYSALQVNANALAISAAAPGYVNVNLAGIASGGTGHYAFSIDLNGDGRFDNHNQTLYSSVTQFQNMYTLFSGTRDVGIRVLDTECQNVASASRSVNFAAILPAAQSGAMAAIAPYYYLQGNINPLTAADNDAADRVLPFQAMEGPATPRLHVDCSYNKTSMAGPAEFAIRGINAYDDGTVPGGVNAALVHGITMNIGNITDAGGAGPYVAAANINSISYQSAASLDGGARQYTFRRAANCTATVQITRAAAAVPCASGTGITSPTVTIQGVYSCPLLHANSLVNDTSPTAATGRDISITNGYFFCEYAPADQCVGGGGQGGGGLPPPVF